MPERFLVFATVGNATQPFDRFVRMVDEAAARTGLRTLIQVGRSNHPPEHAEAVAFIGRPEFERLVREADFVVTHAGVGSVMTSIGLGKAPLVVVRRSRLGEVIDDHQAELATELSRAGLIRIAESAEDLVAHFRNGPEEVSPDTRGSNGRMLEIVHQFLS